MLILIGHSIQWAHSLELIISRKVLQRRTVCLCHIWVMIREHFSLVAWLKSSNQGLQSVPDALWGLSAGIIQQPLGQKQIHLATLTLNKNKTAKRLPKHDAQRAKWRTYINVCNIIWGICILKDPLYGWSTIFYSPSPYKVVCNLIIHRHCNKYVMNLLRWFSKLKFPAE